MRWPWLICAFSLAPFSCAEASRAQEIRVAAAADLKFAMQNLAAQFEKQTSITVKATYGSSGNFYSQLRAGAPFDVFFSADAEYPKELSEAGLAEEGTLGTYAFGSLVIWMPAYAGRDLVSKGWNALLGATVTKIAIANPEHAPYGRAALAALQNAGLYDRVKTKLVFGEDVSQAAQFVQSENAQAGLLPLSLAVSPAMREGQFWEIPPSLYRPIVQAAVVMKDAKNKRGARLFLEFVRSPAGKGILARNGFRSQDSGSVEVPR